MAEGAKGDEPDPDALGPGPDAEPGQASSDDAAVSEDPVDGAPERIVSSDMQRFIGRQLRAVYDDIARQPVPDRFLQLMAQLDSKTRG